MATAAEKSNLQLADFLRAANRLKTTAAAIKAVCEVEAPKGGFYADGTPTLLFERHKFHKHTYGRWSKTYPGISNPTPGGYGSSGLQHERMGQAAKLDRVAALKSASWGRFQILGENYKQCGFETLQQFVNAMYRDEASQLEAFVGFILADSRLVAALQEQDWKTFARIYNGPNYAINAYDTKLAKAFAKHSAEGAA